MELYLAIMKGPLPTITFNYLGQFDQNTSSSSWEFASVPGESDGLDSDPQSQSDSLLDVTGACYNNGQLGFSVDSQLGKDVTRLFMTTFKEKLQEIINHGKSGGIRERLTIEVDKDLEPYFEFNGTGDQEATTLFILPPGEGGAESYFNNIVRR